MGSVPIGYGVAVTAMQMLDVYTTLANHGMARPPRLVDATVDANGTRHAAPLPAPMRFIVPAHRMATRAHLPPRLQAEYGLSQSTLHARMLPLAARSLKLTAWPLLRAPTRLSPPARPHGSRHT